MSSPSDLDAVASSIDTNIGVPPWGLPDGYPSSVALCVLDSIWSIGVKYEGVVNVVNAYRQLRMEEGGNADTDSAVDLLAVMEAVGGPAAFADAVNNHQRTSSTGGILKAEAVKNAAEIVRDSNASTMRDLKGLSADQLELLEHRWSKAHGQSSGLSFTYFLMLTGVEDVKADRWICAFVSDALGRTVTTDESRALLTAFVDRDYPTESLTALDYAIWRFQRDK